MKIITKFMVYEIVKLRQYNNHWFAMFTAMKVLPNSWFISDNFVCRDNHSVIVETLFILHILYREQHSTTVSCCKLVYNGVQLSLWLIFEEVLVLDKRPVWFGLPPVLTHKSTLIPVSHMTETLTTQYDNTNKN